MKFGPLVINWEKKGLINSSSVDRSKTTLSSIPNISALWGQYSDGELIKLYHSIAEVFTPIHLIAFCVAHGNYQVKKIKDDTVVYDNSYMNKLLSTPNPLQNFTELVYQKEAYELITGKSFVYANVPDPLSISYRNVATLINLAADAVQIRTAPLIKILSATKIEDLILDYLVPDGAYGLVPIKPNKVMYTKYASMEAFDRNIIGKSPLLSAQKAVDNLKAAYDARNVILTKRGALGFIVSKKSDADGLSALTKPEKEELIKDYHKTYGLTGAKSPVAITSLPIDYINVAMSLADLQVHEETESDCAAIFATYQVPRELMPRQKGATYENQNSAKKALYDDVIIPRANSLAQSLNTFLRLEESGFYLTVDFSHVKVLQENLKEKSEVDSKNNETYKSRFLNGMITLNDWRAEIKQDKVVNALYDKLIYDMTPDELQKIEAVIKLSGNSAKSIQPAETPAKQ